MPFEQRLEGLVAWLRLPPAQRPAFIAFYFEETNSAGHNHGPESSALAAAARLLDAQLGTLRTRLAADLPAHFQLKDNPRIAPVWVLPELGWHVLPRKRYELTCPSYIKGDHGYDPALPAMHGIFVASGPSFRADVVTEAVENIHIYNLLCAAQRLTPAPNDGDDRLVRAALR